MTETQNFSLDMSSGSTKYYLILYCCNQFFCNSVCRELSTNPKRIEGHNALNNNTRLLCDIKIYFELFKLEIIHLTRQIKKFK